jgi:asparagine synthetase B (glutamine-hydrolysing)
VCPFLATEFIEYAMTLPTELLIRPDLPRGQGEKWILRQIASKYGLHAAANRPKQAMQFGSKVAKADWRGDGKVG